MYYERDTGSYVSGDTEMRSYTDRRYCGLEEWQRYFLHGHQLNNIYAAPEFPWSLDMLDGPCPFEPKYKLRETHSFFLGLPHVGPESLTAEYWHGSATRLFCRPDKRVLGSEAFTRRTCPFRWHMMRPVYSINGHRPPSSGGQMFPVLPGGYFPASLVQAVTCLVTLQRADYWRLPPPGTLLRCSDGLDGSPSSHVGLLIYSARRVKVTVLEDTVTARNIVFAACRLA